jgi:hypothetical protein
MPEEGSHTGRQDGFLIFSKEKVRGVVVLEEGESWLRI